MDLVAPTVAITSPATGSSQSGTFNVSGTAGDAHTGIDHVRLTWTGPQAPGTGVICDPATLGGSSPAWTFTCPWATAAFADGPYTVTATSYDLAGNVSATNSITLTLDNQPPVIAWHSWNEVSGGLWMHNLVNVAWVNPNAPAGAYQLDARVTASDLGSGMNRVEFPAMGAGWTPAALSNATFTSPVPALNGWTRSFTFANPAALAAPGVKSATAYDNALNPSTTSYEVRLDGTAPTGMNATVVNGRQNTGIVAVSLTNGTEGALESGLGSWTLEYETAPLSNDTCGAWSGTWTAATSGVGLAPATYNHDVTLLGSQCYHYRLKSTDNVNNSGTSVPGAPARRVDLVVPTVAITGPATGSSQSGTFNVSGTAGDTHTGIDHVRLTWNRTAPTIANGVICDPATLGGSSPAWTFTCSWNTSLLADGTYVLTATSYDLAGNVSAANTITITLDNQAPIINWHSFLDYGDTNIHYVGNIAWLNPNAPPATRALDARVTATDAGSGVNRVEFPALGPGWAPGATTNGTFTSPLPAANAYTLPYSVTIPGITVEPGTVQARAYDNAGNSSTVSFTIHHDAAPPSGSSISYANGYVGTTTVPVTFTTGDDGVGESGFRDYLVLRSEGTLSAGSCVGWSAFATLVTSGTAPATGVTVNNTVTDPGCFRYEIITWDNVGNTLVKSIPNEVKVDLTPPTGTLTIAKNANPAWQYLQTPTRLYINTSAAHSGTFDVNVTANAASGIMDATYPVLAAGITGGGVQPGPGPNFSLTYAWAAGASNPTPPKNVLVRSNSLAPLSLPFEVIADPAAPVGATVSYTSGYTVASSVAVTYTSGNDGAGSGIAGWQLEREQGTLALGACTWSGTWTPAGGVNGASYTDPTLAHANCYRYRVSATDNVGNVSAPAPGPAIMVDQTAPTATMDWVENGTGNGTYTSGSTIWYQPTLGTFAAKEQFSMRVHIVDAESGPGAVTFPAAWAGNWAAGPTTLNVDGAQRRYDRWNFANEPGAVSAIAANGAGMTVTVNGNVLADAAVSSAASWSIDYVHGFDIDLSLDASWVTSTTDNLSGYAKVDLVRRSWPFVGATGSCDNTAAPVDVVVAPNTVATSYTDTAVTQPTCYRYFLRVYDRAENVATIWASTGGAVPPLFPATWPTWDYKTIASVDDIFPPQPFTITLPTNPALPAITTGQPTPACTSVPTYTGSTPALTWSASSDLESGLKEYRIYLDGTVTADGTVAAPATTWTPLAQTDGAHTLGVRAYDNQFNNTNAGPAFPTNIRIDSVAPTATLVSPAAGGWTLDTTPLLDWTASDTNCLARVEVYLDDMVTPVAVASGSEGSWQTPAAIASGSHTWKVVAIDTLGNATTAGPATFGIDVVPPTAFAVTSPTAGGTVRGFVNVAWSPSSDIHSGLAPSNTYEVWVDGILKTAVGPGFTVATVNGITNGSHTVFVRARDLVGNFTDTAPITFTGYPAIPAPVLVSPANLAQINAVPLLDWSWTSDGGPPPTSYDVYVDGSVVGTDLYPITAHAIADPGDGLHTWKVVQTDPYTGTVSSATRTFNLDRTPPINAGPLSRVGTVVSWPAPVDPAAPTASGILNQQFVIEDNFGAVLFTIPRAAASTSYDYASLGLPDGIYKMYVIAYDKAGNASTTPQLTVINDSVPPVPFNLDPPPALPALPAITTGAAAPTCETVPTYVGTTPTLTWQASSDATTGLAGYDVYIDGALVGSVGPAITSYTVSTPLSGGVHTWQVVATDGFGLTRTSTPAPMTVRVDGASPMIAYVTPLAGSFTADSTPTLNWAGSDDNCFARVEVSIDGAVVATVSGVSSNYTPPAALAEGSHTWSLRAFDSAGNLATSGAPRTFTVDLTPPTAVTAIFPTNAGSAPEQMMTFQWSAGTDALSGISRYDLIVDGIAVANGVVATSRGTFSIYAGPHTWAIRAYDNVGNSAMFNFAFTATPVPDVTPPNAFNLLSPADAAPVSAGFAMTWEPAWDFKGVTQYRVYIDGGLVGTTAGNVTTFTPSVGAGTPICTIDYDPATSAGCLTGPTYANGEVTGGASTPAAVPASDWNTAAYAGWNASGSAHGFGNPTIAPSTAVGAGFDGDRMWSAVQYNASIPMSGAALRFEHRYLAHKVGNNAYDGMTVEVRVDAAGDGFANDTWKATCSKGARAIYGSTLNCLAPNEIVEVNGGYNVVFAGPATNHPLAYQNGYSGDSQGMVQTKMDFTGPTFLGKNIQIRFKVGTDSCYSGMPAAQATYCSSHGAAGWHRAVWRIDNVALTSPDLLPGPHSWYIEARDAAGNSTASNQTWTFNLS